MRTARSYQSTSAVLWRFPAYSRCGHSPTYATSPPIDFREGRIEQYEPFRQTILAKDYVRYVGEPVAAVFAENVYIAEDAADLVEVDVEELPPILSPAEKPR